MSNTTENTQGEFTLAQFLSELRPIARRADPDYAMHELMVSGRRVDAPTTNSTIIKGVNTRLSANDIRGLIPIRWPVIPLEPPTDGDGNPGVGGPQIGGGGPGPTVGGGGGPGGGCCGGGSDPSNDGTGGTGGSGTADACCGTLPTSTSTIQYRRKNINQPFCPDDGTGGPSNYWVRDHDETGPEYGCCNLVGSPCGTTDTPTLCGGTAGYSYDSGLASWYIVDADCCWTCTMPDGTTYQTTFPARNTGTCTGLITSLCATAG